MVAAGFRPRLGLFYSPKSRVSFTGHIFFRTMEWAFQTNLACVGISDGNGFPHAGDSPTVTIDATLQNATIVAT